MIPRPPTSTLFPYTTLFRSFTGSGEPERVAALGVTANFFSVLGVAPAHGRNFLPEEEQSGRNHVAILSDGLWRRRFGADPNLIGRQIQLSGESYTVVGDRKG